MSGSDAVIQTNFIQSISKRLRHHYVGTISKFLHLTFQEPSRTDTTQCLNTLQKGTHREDSISLFKNSKDTEDGELFRDRVKSTADDATMAALTGLTAEVACVQIGLYKGRRRYHWRIRPPTKAFSTHKHMALSPTIAKTAIRSNCNSCSRVSSTADLQPLAIFITLTTIKAFYSYLFTTNYRDPDSVFRVNSIPLVLLHIVYCFLYFINTA